jgi:hypothetical protein
MITYRHIVAYFVTLTLACIGVIFTMTPSPGDEPDQHQAKLNGGYYLLHQLADDEAQLPILLDLKHAPPEVVQYADKISKAGKETEGALEEMQDHDSKIQLDRNPLPPIEQNVRDSIKDDKQHQLLFGTSNAEFVRALIISQIEATTYALHLSKVLADQESDPARVKKLQHLSAHWLALRNEAFSILRNY